MRTLAKPPKPKNQPVQGNIKVEQGRKQGKGQSKKVTKTVFHSPFRYKIQALSLEQGQQVAELLASYCKQLRSQLGIAQKKKQNEKFISFTSQVAHQKPPLTSNQLLPGIKNCIKGLKKGQQFVKMVLIFYDQNIHDVFQELMCNVLYHKVPYVVMKDSPKLKAQLGVKKLLSLGLLNEEVVNALLKYCSRCLIEIPWLVDTVWVPLIKNKEK